MKYNVTITKNNNKKLNKTKKHPPPVIYKALYLDVAQGRVNWTPNETRTHSCGCAGLAC